jgi:hypothetical protein
MRLANLAVSVYIIAVIALAWPAVAEGLLTAPADPASGEGINRQVISSGGSDGSSTDYPLKGAVAPLQAAAYVTSTIPGSYELDVPVASNITVTFNLDMNASTINSSTFKVYGQQSGPTIGAISYDAPSRTATFDPTVDFLPGEQVSVVLTDGVTAVDLQQLDNGYSWAFRVRAESPGIVSFYQETCSTYVGMSGAMQAVDLNGDQAVDIVCTSLGDDSLVTLLNDGSGSFSRSYTAEILEDQNNLSCADLDADGDQDVIVSCGEVTGSPFDMEISVLLNNGDGSFAPRQDISIGQFPFGVASNDLDNDGDIDIMATSEDFTANLVVLWNNGSGSFTGDTILTGLGGGEILGVTAADVDSDGLSDIVFGDANNASVWIMQNLGGGAFASPTEYDVNSWAKYPYGCELDGDNSVDLVTINEPSDRAITVIPNSGTGTYPSYTRFTPSGQPYDVSIGDIDGDGDLDLMSGTVYDSLVMLVNDGSGLFAWGQSYSLDLASAGKQVCSSMMRLCRCRYQPIPRHTLSTSPKTPIFSLSSVLTWTRQPSIGRRSKCAVSSPDRYPEAFHTKHSHGPPR